MTEAEYEGPHYWNYRVRLTFVPVLTEDSEEEEVHEIIEAYYNAQDEIEMWSEPMKPQGETVDDLRADLMHMLEALDKPVLLASELPGA